MTSQGKPDKADDTKVTTLLADFTPLTAVRYLGNGELDKSFNATGKLFISTEALAGR